RAGKPDSNRLAAAIQALGGDHPDAQREALGILKTLGGSALPALPAIRKLAEQTKDEAVRKDAQAVLQSIFAVPAYSRAEVEEIRQRAECHPTGSTSRPREADGRLRLTARVAGNGLNF